MSAVTPILTFPRRGLITGHFFMTRMFRPGDSVVGGVARH